MPFDPATESILNLLRGNWPDTYDKIAAVSVDPDIGIKAISVVENSLWGTASIPLESAMSISLRQYIANEATLFLIPAARSFYANRNVLSETMESGNQRNQVQRYDWTKVLDSLERSLIIADQKLWLIVSSEIAASTGIYPDYPSTNSKDLLTVLTEVVPLNKRYHVTPDPLKATAPLYGYE